MEYTDKGHGQPILISHGTPGGKDHLLLFEELTTDFRVICPSRPGYLGTPLGSHSDLDGQVWLFRDLIDQLGLSQVSLLSHSGGGPFSLRFAQLYPHKVDKLILCSSLVKADKIGFMSKLLWQNWLIRLGGLFAPKYKPYLKLLLPKRKRIDGFNNDVKIFKDLPPFDFSTITCPTLILHDPNDSFVDFSQAQLAHQGIAGSVLITAKGNHFLTIGPDKDMVYDEMRNFLTTP